MSSGAVLRCWSFGGERGGRALRLFFPLIQRSLFLPLVSSGLLLRLCGV